MNSLDKKAVKAGAWYTVGNIISKGMNFLTVPIFSRILTKPEFGAYNNFISWMAIFSVISTLNVSATLYSARYDFEERLDDYKTSIIVLSAVASIITMLMIFVINGMNPGLFRLDTPYILLMFIGIVFSLVVDLYQIDQRMRYNYRSVLIVSVSMIASNIALSIALIAALEDNLLGRIAGAQLSVVIIGLVLLIRFLKQSNRVTTTYWNYALRICIPFIPHLLSMNLLNSMDRVMITNFCGETYTALYSVAYSCGIAIRVITSAFNGAFDPWMCQNIHDKTFSRVKKASRKFVALIAFLIVGIMLLSPEVLHLMGGKSYIDAKYVMIPVALGCFCQFLYTFYVNVEQFKKKTVLMAIATVIAAVFNYVSNYYLIPQFGYSAAAYTTLASYGLLMVMHYYLVKRIGLNILFDNSFFMICFVGLSIIGVGIGFLYQYGTIRLVAIIVYTILLSAYLWRNRYIIENKFRT